MLINWSEWIRRLRVYFRLLIRRRILLLLLRKLKPKMKEFESVFKFIYTYIIKQQEERNSSSPIRLSPLNRNDDAFISFLTRNTTSHNAWADYTLYGKQNLHRYLQYSTVIYVPIQKKTGSSLGIARLG